MFMPGIPQVWYLDIFAGKNDYGAADKGGSGGHKEINRTTLSLHDVEQALKRDIVIDQLAIIRLRNSSQAFLGKVEIKDTPDGKLDIVWKNQVESAQLKADLKTLTFTINYTQNGIAKSMAY